MLPVNGLYGHIQRNYLKSALLLLSFVAMAGVIWYAWCLLYTGFTLSPGKLVGGKRMIGRQPDIGLETYLEAARLLWLDRWWVPLLISAFWFAVCFSFHAALIRMATRTLDADRGEHLRLFKIVERLSLAAGLPVPHVEIITSDALNAYASGLFADDTVVAVTRGLLAKLDDDELEAVVAHELSHIKNRDVRLMVTAMIFAGGLSLAGDALSHIWKSGSSTDGFWIGRGAADALAGDGNGGKGGGTVIALVVIALAIALMLAVKLLATLAQLALSRSREYLADAGAIELTKNPEALIRALRKISGEETIPRLPAQLRPMMFSDSAASWFSTHPSIDDRIQALIDYAGANPELAAVSPRRRSRDEAGSSAPAPAGALAFAGARPAFGRRRRVT